MTIGGSMALIVIGAILRFAITWHPAHVDLQVIGVILMIAGAVGLAISAAFLVARRRQRASAEVYEERRYTQPPARWRAVCGHCNITRGRWTTMGSVDWTHRSPAEETGPGGELICSASSYCRCCAARPMLLPAMYAPPPTAAARSNGRRRTNMTAS